MAIIVCHHHHHHHQKSHHRRHRHHHQNLRRHPRILLLTATNCVTRNPSAPRDRKIMGICSLLHCARRLPAKTDAAPSCSPRHIPAGAGAAIAAPTPPQELSTISGMSTTWLNSQIIQHITIPKSLSRMTITKMKQQSAEVGI